MRISINNKQLLKAKERLNKRELTPITEDNINEYYKHYESMWCKEPYFNSSDWDEITNIFTKAIKRKGLTKEEVRELTDRLLNEE